MNKKHTLMNQRGDSLIAVVVALGLAGVLTVVIMNNMSLQNKATKTAEIQNNLNDFKRLLQDFVGRTEPCQATFNGVQRGEDILALKQKTSYTGNAFAEVGKEFQRSGFIIKEMRLLTLKEQRDLNNGDHGQIDQKGVGTAYLRVKLEKIRAEGSNAKFFGGKDTAVIVPIVAEFGGDDIIADGIDKNDAAEAWKAKFTNLDTAEDGKITAMGLPATDYDLKPQEGKKPGDTPDIPNSAYIDMGTNWTVIWGVYHPNFSVSDCGSHLSI